MKKVVSWILAVMLLVAILPQHIFAATTPGDISVEEAKSKIYKLYNILGEGSHFTVNHTYCNKKWESSHACSNCKNGDIVKQTWFKNLFGTVTTSQFPKTYYYSGKAFYGTDVWSCAAFAAFAEWYIYSSTTTDKVTTKYIGSFEFTSDNMVANLRTGDLIRLHKTSKTGSGSHSAIVISCDTSGVKVLDCNSGIGGTQCEVYIRDIKYSAYKYVAISRATNSVICNHQYNSCGKCPNCGNVDSTKHSLSTLNSTGECTSCTYKYDCDTSMSTSAAGTYKVTVSGGINFYEKPYSASGTSGNKVPNGTQIEVLYSVKNHYGNTWYRFKYNGQEGYTSKDNVTFVSSTVSSTILAQSITCTLTDPTEGQKIVKGAHPVKGTVTSKNYPLQEVKAYLDGSCIATVTLGSAYSLDIRSSAINTNLAFGSLSLGNHTLVIKARDTKHSDLVTVMTRNFVITDSSGNTGTDTSCSCVTAFAGYYLCTTTGTNLYIRSGHGSSYSTVGNVTKGAVVYIDKASGTGSSDWGHVTFNGVSGYCSMQYMKKLSTYTVSYNANGGSGAPGSQTKIQDVALTLSTTKPTRSGYTFLGWSTSSSATSASYSAGGSYTGNGNVTLYAVWKSNACSHSYSGKITTAATCSKAGVKTYTCSKCGNSYTETIAATGNHVYGSWTTEKAASCTAAGTQQRKCNTCSKTESKTVSATGHDYKSVTSIATCTKPEETTYTCRNCNYSYSEKTGTQTAPHKWDSGKITTSATCAKEGVKTYTCSVCKQTKTEKIAKLQTHTYTEWYLTSNAQHQRDCKVCGDTQYGTHEFYDEWVISEKGHSKLCRICNDEISYSHTPGPKATETEPQVCTTCGYVIKPALGHTHQWSNAFSYDINKHWHTCEGCSEKENEEQHSYQSSCDEFCDICGAERPIIHLFNGDWYVDADNHWAVCACGVTNCFGPHKWEDGICAVCDIEQHSDNEQPDSSDQAGELEQPGKDEQPETDRKPLFIKRVVDCFAAWFEQMKDPEVIRDLIEAAKEQKIKREILTDVQESLLPDGEYRMMFYEDKIHTIDGIEYAYVDLLESVSFEDPYVKSLKTGSLIDLSKYGLESIEVANTRITADAQSEMILQLDEWGEFYLDRPYGQKAWMLRTFNDKQVQYVLDHIAIELVDDVQIADECYRMLNENGNARYPNTIAELFALYVGQTGGDLEIMVTMQAGKAVNATFYYAPVI